ncbi:MAG: PEP-CTERM sorting domain-containing protein [Okeania sp. SIO2C2]|nr:PEP-CTERM sorting domain-containing protein [Okeania sp. SIO2C2]
MGVVDFESGFTDGQLVNSVTANNGNVLTFWTGNQTPTSNPEIAQIGDPITAFSSSDGATLQSQIGNFFLTDGLSGPGASNYFIEFSQAVSEVSIDLLDLDALSVNGGPGVATVTVFSDSFSTVINSQDFLGSTGPVSLETLDTFSISGNLNAIKSLSIVYSVNGAGDIGTGIDNITFTQFEPSQGETQSTPEPASILGLLAFGAAGAGSKLKRK